MDLQENAGNKTVPAHTGITTAAKQWQGWGTALKPASEHWILVRKPLSEKTVAANVLKWGTGALNIDGCRIPANTEDIIAAAEPQPQFNSPTGQIYNMKTGKGRNGDIFDLSKGRFPANLILDETAAAMLDAQSGNLKGPGNTRRSVESNSTATVKFNSRSFSEPGVNNYPGQEGGASRFFYVAKASTAEKNAGVEKNTHPTVKSLKLMEYLIKLVTPPNGCILDPFMGSGSTGVAAQNLNFRFVGIERETEYFEIAKARMTVKDPKDADPRTKQVQEPD